MNQYRRPTASEIRPGQLWHIDGPNYVTMFALITCFRHNLADGQRAVFEATLYVSVRSFGPAATMPAQDFMVPIGDDPCYGSEKFTLISEAPA